jgi:hypothetical protein
MLGDFVTSVRLSHVAEFQFRCNKRENVDIFRGSDQWMLTNYKWLATAIAIVLLIIADWAWSSFGPCIQGEKQQPYQCTETNYDITQMVSYRAIVSLIDFIEKRHDLVTAFATVIIALFTITLWRATSGLLASAKEQSRDMKSSIAVANKAANAAKASADALKATERGILMEKISSVDFSRAYSAAESYPNSPSMWPITAELSTTITFKNYGKTPITIQEICGNVVIADATPRIKDGVFAIEHKLTEYVISPRSESDAIPFKVSKEISWDKNNKITRGTMHIWLIGSVTFVDVFDVTCHREFVWKYSRRSNALKPYHSYEECTHQSAVMSEPP